MLFFSFNISVLVGFLVSSARHTIDPFRVVEGTAISMPLIP